jgi:hypothetical protein
VPGKYSLLKKEPEKFYLIVGRLSPGARSINKSVLASFSAEKEESLPLLTAALPASTEGSISCNNW